MKRAVCLLVAVIMVASLFTGCSEGKSDSAIKSQIEAVKDKIVGTSGVVLPPMELENKTVVFYTHLKDEDFYAKEGEAPKAGDLFEAVYGGKLEIIPIVNWGEYESKLYGMYMSDDMPDMIQGGIGQMAKFMGKDLIQPINPYIDTDTELWDGVRTTLDEWKWRGEDVYELPYEQDQASLVYFNPKMFEEQGIKTPLEYYEEGNWTWDTFREIAIAMTKDTNGDGETDVYGVQMDPTNIVYAVDSTGDKVIDTSGDYPVFKLDSQKIADAANFCRDLGPAKYNVCGGDFTQGTAAMSWLACNSGGDNEGWRINYKDIWADGTVDFVPPPRYPEVDVHYISTRPNPGILAKKAKNPQGAAAFMACMRYVQTPEFREILDPEENWKKRYVEMGWTEEQIERMFVELPTLPRAPWTYAAWTVDGVPPAYGSSELNEKPWSQLLEEVKPQHEANLKQYVDAIKSVEAGNEVDLTEEIKQMEEAQKAAEEAAKQAEEQAAEE